MVDSSQPLSDYGINSEFIEEFLDQVYREDDVEAAEKEIEMENQNCSETQFSLAGEDSQVVTVDESELDSATARPSPQLILQLIRDVAEVREQVSSMEEGLKMFKEETNRKLDEITGNIFELLQCVTDRSMDNSSQSLLQSSSSSTNSGSSSTPCILLNHQREPFVFFRNEEGNLEPLVLDTKDTNDFLGEGTVRGLVRKVLLWHFKGDIAELRRHRLTDSFLRRNNPNNDEPRAEKDDDGDGEGAPDPQFPGRKVLPLKVVRVAEAIVIKVMPPKEGLKAVEGAYEAAISALKQSTRSNITKILNYFSTQYDDKGVKIQSESKSAAKKRRME